ncbi:MAG: glycosyltransferase family 2 protein [Rhodospirillales bacterium]|nr:glycosyltransferase family 2 protein [Rhodospirillales bacterium]
MTPVSVIVLTFNSAATIGATLDSLAGLTDDVHVVDSGSTDETRAIAAARGAKIVEHPFENYGAQRNWAIANLPLAHEWQLHLDADERLSPGLKEEIESILSHRIHDAIGGFYIPRLVRFQGRMIRRGGMYPIYHMRLFRTGRGRCEARKYDQHFQADGQTPKLVHPMIDDIRLSLTEWTARHNRWADAEVDEILNPGGEGVIGPGSGDPVAEKRRARGLYYSAPMFLRAFALFFYRYVLRRGFLDGKEGLIFYVLQTFWFRFLVDAKLHERRKAAKKP